MSKPWNPITQLAYKVGVPLVRTYFSSTNVYNSTGAYQEDQGDDLMKEVNRVMKACRESSSPLLAALDVSFTTMLESLYDGTTSRTCASSRSITGGKTVGGYSAADLLADPKFNYQVHTVSIK